MIKIRKHAIMNLYKYVSQKYFEFEWKEIDNKVNPLCEFGCTDWKKLYNYLDEFTIGTHHNYFFKDIDEMELVIGSFKEVMNLIECEIKPFSMVGG